MSDKIYTPTTNQKVTKEWRLLEILHSNFTGEALEKINTKSQDSISALGNSSAEYLQGQQKLMYL